MAGWTNKGKYRTLGYTFRGDTIPTNFYIALVTSAVAPAADIDTFTELTEIAAGNGYTAGGESLTPGDTDFDTWTEDDANDRALVQLKDIVWTASGGGIPDSGDGARYSIITDDNATQSAREILWYHDLSSDRSVSDGQSLTLQDVEIRITES